MYQSTKSYLNNFCETLAVEVNSKGVDVQSLCPGFVKTEIFKNPNFDRFGYETLSGPMWTEIDVVIDDSLRALGRRRVVFVPGARMRLLIWIASLPVIRGIVRAYVNNL